MSARDQAADDIEEAGESRIPNQPEGRGSTSVRQRLLVGREREISELTAAVASSPLTTVTGPGCVGKSAIALAVAAASAERFPDGVFVVWLADRDVLLVLDNCEHVVSTVADLVDGLTARLPRLHVLATSREPLWVVEEVSYRLAPLPVADRGATRAEIDSSPAVRLFRERAGARTPASLDTDDAGRLLLEICRRVDGLPLAIELAAARVAGLDLEDIDRHLDDLFELLPQSARRADGVHRSLRATVAWSDALLHEDERQLLWRMGVFAGEFDLAAIREVCADDGQAAARVADLAAVGELDRIRDRHARYFLGVAPNRLGRRWRVPSDRTWMCSAASRTTPVSRSSASS